MVSCYSLRFLKKRKLICLATTKHNDKMERGGHWMDNARFYFHKMLYFLNVHMTTATLSGMNNNFTWLILGRKPPLQYWKDYFTQSLADQFDNVEKIRISNFTKLIE